MAAATLELCVAAVKTVLQASPLSYASTAVSDGRRPPPARGQDWAHIQRVAGEPTTLLSGARKRAYVLDVSLRRRGGDRHEEDAIDEALQGKAEALHDAFDGRTRSTYTTLTGLEIVRAELVSRDLLGAGETEQVAVVRLTFTFFEAY